MKITLTIVLSAAGLVAATVQPSSQPVVTPVAPQTVMIPRTGSVTVTAGTSSWSLAADGPGWVFRDGVQPRWKLVQIDDRWWRLDNMDANGNALTAWRAESCDPGVPTIFRCEDSSVAAVVVTR